MNCRLVHRGPDSDGLFDGGQASSPPGGSRSSTSTAGDQPIANEDGSVVVVQNGEIYNYRELRRELERRGPPLRAPPRDTEVLVHLYEEHGDALRSSACAACSRSRSGTRASRRLLLARDRFGIKPLYYRARTAASAFASELKALLELPGLLARDRPRGARRLPRLQLDPGAADDLRRGAQAAARPPAGLARRGAEPSARYARPAPGAGRAGAGKARGQPGRRAARDACATRSAPTWSPTCPSACCSRAGSTRPAWRRWPRGESGERGEDLLDRLRGVELRRARARARWSPSATAPTTTSSSSARTRPSCCRSWSRPSTSPSATPRRCPPTSSPQLAAGERQGGALGRGRRRALRRLLHLRRRPRSAPRVGRLARLAAPAGRARCRARLAGESARLQGQALRPRRPPAAARAPPRLEGDLLGRGCGPRSCGGHRLRLGPGRPLPRSATPRPPAPSRWPGSRTSTSASTSSTTCWSRPTARAWPTRWSCGCRSSTSGSPSFALGAADRGSRCAAWPRSGCCAERAGAAAAQGDRARPQAGLLDPARRLAARPARAVRARGALAGDARAPGLPRPRRGHAAARPPLRRRARTSAASSGG